FLIEIVERLATGILMLRKIVIGPVGDTFKLLPAERKIVLDIVSAFGVEGAIRIRHGNDVQLLSRQPDIFVKLEPLLQPIVEQGHPLLWPAEIFQLHLLKFARAKNVIAWIDLVTKRLPNLCNAER